MKKSCRKCETKASPRPLLILVNKKNCQCMQENLLKITYFEGGLSKTLTLKLTLFFQLNLVPFNRQDYEKQKGPGTRDQPLFRLKNKFRKIPLLVLYYPAKFELFQKLHLLIYASQFMT